MKSQADLDLSKANLNLARLTVERWRRLAKGGVVARQEADQKEADFAVTEAQVAKAQASIATTQETVHAQRSQSAPPGRDESVCPHHRAVRWRDHRAQRGYRHADQFRQRRRGPRVVPHRADPGPAHLRQRAADQRRLHAPRPNRRTARAGVARPGLRRAE